MRAAVDAARTRIATAARRTECRRSESLGEAAGAEVWLKLEQRQTSGSFKLRGVMNALLSLPPEQRRRRLVAASTGNHGAAFAHAVTELGLDGLLFLPRTATATKLAAIEASGLPFELVGSDCVETEHHARDLARRHGWVWLSPYNDPAVVAGQGTVAPELAEQVPGLGAVLVPVGGGGLAAGVASWFAGAVPTVEIVGCEPEASPEMSESVRAGRIVELPTRPTLSDATAGGIEPDAITFDLCRRHVARWQTVSEDEIAAAIRFLHDREDMTVEGGAALGVAVLLRRPAFLRGKRVAVIITGSRIDPEALRAVLGR